MSNLRKVRGSMASEVKALTGLIQSSDFLADYGFRTHRLDLWLEGTQGLADAVSWASDLLLFENPSVMPQTPAEWLLSVRAAILGYYALRRQMKRGQGKISRHTFRRWANELIRMEPRIVLQTRVMREDFLRKWPRAWTARIDSEFRPWYGRKLR